MYFEHNIEIYERFEPVILEHHECCLVATMGTGKTDICIEFIKRYNLNTLVILPTVDLCNQWKDIAEKNDICTLSTVTYHTFSKAFAVLSVGFDCYIFDEAHHMDSAIWGKAIRKFKEMIDEDKYIIGLTGDPVRYFDSCKNVVDTMFHGHVAYGLTQYEAIMNGILPNVIYVCAIYDTKGLYDKYKGMATTKHLQGKLNLAYENCKKINDILITHAMDHMKGFVFVDKIESIGGGVDLISKAFPDMPVYSAHSNMTKDEKSNNIKGFKSSNMGFMVSVNMFNEGHHVSGTNTIIMLRKTGSPTVYAQQIGRALSANHSGTAIIYDFVANSESMKSISKRISIITNMIDGELNKGLNLKRNDRISNQVIVHDHSRDFLEVIEEIEVANSGVVWSTDEDLFLIDNYKINGIDFCTNALNRTRYHVKKRAKDLGLYKFITRWTPEEDVILKEFYPTMGSKVASKIHGKSENACKYRAIQLGIEYIRSDIWTPEEDAILKEFYPTMGSDVVSKLPGRTKEACKSRAQNNGIYSLRSWTPEEDEILKEFYPIMGDKIVSKLPGRSKDACKRRAIYMNIINTDRSWTPEEDAILKEFYPTMGIKVVSKLSNRSVQACTTRAQKLNIKSRYFWTPEEDAILKEFYPTMGRKVASKIPGRTESSCISRAKTLDLVEHNRWSQNEDVILKEFYPTMGRNVASMLNRDQKACISRARRLGLMDNSAPCKWTPEEDAIIKEFYPTMGRKVASKLPGRTKDTCKHRAIFLGVRSNKYSSTWSEEEDEIIKKFYPTIGSNVTDMLNCRSKQACVARAKELNIKFYRGSWSEAEDVIIKEFYPIMGSKVVSKLPNRSIQACTSRAKKLGIKYIGGRNKI